MKVFRINLSKSYKAFLEHKKVTCPVFGHIGYSQMSKIKKGDLIFLMKERNEIFSIGIALSDTFIGNVSYYNMLPQFTNDDLFTLAIEPLEMYKLDQKSLEGCFSGNPIFSKNFCLECYPKSNMESIIPRLNALIFGSYIDELVEPIKEA